MSQVYERELKGILMADPEVLKRVVAHLPPEEQLAYMRIIERPFVVVRAAGSFGVDMAVVGIIPFLVEEKTSVDDVYHFNKPRIIEQAEHLKRLCMEAGVTPVYAYRLKRLRGGDPWRLFTIELDEKKLYGLQRLFYSRLPKLEYTRSNNYVMRWGSGWPLHSFIDWAASLPRSEYGGGD
ncbi:MAG: Holliday junction resolvase [Thermoplasmata archaeon]